MRQVILQFIGVILCLVGSASVSIACTCMHLRGDPAAAFTASSAVFSGKVLEITEGESAMPASGVKELTVKFRVEKSWKLVRKDEVMVLTVNTGNLCGFTFKVGERYLVYGLGGGNKFMTDICTRTTGLIGAAEDLEYLKSKPLLKVKKSR
jgi:hypothetical protein